MLIVTDAYVTKVSDWCLSKCLFGSPEYIPQLYLEDGPNGLQKCTGVEFLKDEVTHKTQAPSRDVIVSAGTRSVFFVRPCAFRRDLTSSSYVIPGSFKTPHVLELSGIGNKKILAKYGIECKVDLPGVGENLRMSCHCAN